MKQADDAPKTQRLRVLFVDDDRELRDLLIAAVDPLRFDVNVAAGVPAASFLARRHRFELVVCGTVETLAALHDYLPRFGMKGVVFAVTPMVSGARGAIHVVNRPLTANGLREALLGFVTP